MTFIIKTRVVPDSTKFFKEELKFIFNTIQLPIQQSN